MTKLTGYQPAWHKPTDEMPIEHEPAERQPAKQRPAGRRKSAGGPRTTTRQRMRRRLTAALAGVAGMTAVFGLMAAPAHAENTYHPSDADFADCPALPVGAVQSTWKCYVMTVLDGTLQLNTRGVHLTQPLRVTAAQGRMVTGLTKAVFGGLANGGPYPMIAGIAGTPFEAPDPNGWQVQFYSTPTVEAGPVMPNMFGLKARIIGSELSDTCFIGNESEPVIVRPQLNWFYPAAIDGVGVMRTHTDAIFGMPNALGCGDAAAMLKVNAIMNLPAPATADKMSTLWAVRNKAY